MHILIFKTDISNDRDLEELDRLLGAHHNVARWDIDTEDIDNVLRVEALENIPGNIESLLQENGYFCEELPD